MSGALFMRAMWNIPLGSETIIHFKENKTYEFIQSSQRRRFTMMTVCVARLGGCK